MKVTKREIIKALATEPLSGGMWISEDGCEACAVGSFLLYHFTDKSKLVDFCDKVVTRSTITYSSFEQDPEKLYQLQLLEMIDGGLYLSALSAYFEDTVYNNYGFIPTDEDRAEFISFVEAEFPDVIDLDEDSRL